jgi:hypothetical protein
VEVLFVAILVVAGALVAYLAGMAAHRLARGTTDGRS